MTEPDRGWVPPGLERLPDGWRWVGLGSVAAIDPRVRRPTQGPVTVVAMTAVDAASGRITAPESVDAAEAGRHLRPFEPGDVLLAKISPSFENGKVAVARDLAARVGLGSPEFHVIRAGAELEADYLWLILRQPRVRAHLVPTMSGRAGQQRIAKPALARLAIPLPPPSAQAGIVAAAERLGDAYGAGLAHAERARAEVDEVRAAVIADVTFSGAPWHSALLGDLVPEDRPVRYGIVQPGPEHPGGVPYIRVRDFEAGGVSLARLGHTEPAIAARHRAAALRAGDLLVSIRGTVGRLARVPAELEGAHITQDAARISGLDPVLREWVALSIASPAGQRWLRENTGGRAVQGINVETLRQMRLPMPPPEEMERRARLAEKALDAVGRAGRIVDATLTELARIRETATLATALGHGDVGSVPLLAPAPAAADEAPESDGAEIVPVESGWLSLAEAAPAAAEMPTPLLASVAAAGGRIEASDLLALHRKLSPEAFYEQLWEAVQSGLLREPPPGSSTLELIDDAA